VLARLLIDEIPGIAAELGAATASSLNLEAVEALCKSGQL